VSVDATKKEVIDAYHRAKSIYGENSLATYTLYSREESTRMLSLVEEAYSVLTSKEKRELYDIDHGINRSRSVVKIAFNRPGEMRRTLVETPKFSSGDKNEPEAPKSIKNIKPFVAMSRVETSIPVPEFKAADDMENKIKTESGFSGQFLREVREYKNMSIDFVSQKTKVSAFYMECIEREDFDDLPSRVYVRGFIDSLARLLGLPVFKVINAYLKRFDNARRD
jgi:hypothetical protein